MGGSHEHDNENETKHNCAGVSSDPFPFFLSCQGSLIFRAFCTVILRTSPELALIWDPSFYHHGHPLSLPKVTGL